MRSIVGICIVGVSILVACSSVPKYRPIDGGGGGSGGGGNDGSSEVSNDRPPDASSGDIGADTSGDAPDAGTDTPQDRGTTDASDAQATCVPSCEGYQACVNGKCTPTYVATVNLLGGQNVSATDFAPDGSYYIAGTFQGTVDFDPGSNVDQKESSDAFSSIFVTKFKNDGSYAWTRTIVVADETMFSVGSVARVRVGPDGSVVLWGGFSGKLDFDPGLGADVRGASALDAYVVKLTPDGDRDWVGIFAGQSGFRGLTAQSLDIGSDGTLLLSGSFYDSADFDPGLGADVRQASGFPDAFVTKLTSSGGYMWTRNRASDFSDGATALAADGVVWIAGTFGASIDFDPSLATDYRTPRGRSDVFLSRLAASGAYIDTTVIQGADEDRAYAIAVASDGSVYISGHFIGTVDFDPGSAVQNRTADAAMFVLRLGGDVRFMSVYTDVTQHSTSHYLTPIADGSVLVLDSNSAGSLFHLLGDTVVWRIPIPTGIGSTGLAGRAGAFGYTGAFSSTVDFDPGLGRDSVTPASGQSFISRYKF